jgi:hypothetical protein
MGSWGREQKTAVPAASVTPAQTTMTIFNLDRAISRSGAVHPEAKGKGWICQPTWLHRRSSADGDQVKIPGEKERAII